MIHFWEAIQTSGINKSLIKSLNPETYTFYCNWNNPRCSCQHNERWMDFKVSCPSYMQSEVINWFHSKKEGLMAVGQTSSCGKLEISNRAYIQCRGCGIKGRWYDWNYKCSSSSFPHCNGYTRTDGESFACVFTNLMRTESYFDKDLINEIIKEH